MEDQTLVRIEKVVREQLRWTKLAGQIQLKTIFEQNLKSDDEKKVYELSDGIRSIRDIENLTNMGRTKIGFVWKKWYKMGIMEKSEKYEGKRMKRSFSLSDVGMEVELPTDSQTPTQTEEEFE